MNTRRAPHKGFSLQPDASAPAAISRLSRAVKVADIQHGDAGLERGMDGHDGFRVTSVPIAARHGPCSRARKRWGRFVPIEQAASQSPRIFGRAILNKWSANLS